MKMEYLLVKGKDDFCQDEEQFKNLLSSNTRVTLYKNTLEADHKQLSYDIDMYDVVASKETVFHLTFNAEQEKEEEQIDALECAESVLRRINEKVDVFRINTIWDDVSMYYGRKLYPEIIEIEALLRKIIYLFMIKNVGSTWVKKQTPEAARKSIEKTMQKNQLDENSMDIDVLTYADFGTLDVFFSSKYSLKSDYDNLFKILKAKSSFTSEEINALIEQYELKSNWERYFADKIHINSLSEKWSQLYNYRNKVAHTKKLFKSEYKKAKDIIDELKPAFIECLTKLNEINMTEEQSEAVEDVAEQTIVPKTGHTWSNIENGSILYSASISPIISGGNLIGKDGFLNNTILLKNHETISADFSKYLVGCDKSSVNLEFDDTNISPQIDLDSTTKKNNLKG